MGLPGEAVYVDDSDAGVERLVGAEVGGQDKVTASVLYLAVQMVVNRGRTPPHPTDVH